MVTFSTNSGEGKYYAALAGAPKQSEAFCGPASWQSGNAAPARSLYPAGRMSRVALVRIG